MEVRKLIREELEKLVEVEPPHEFGQGDRDPMDDDPEMLRRYAKRMEQNWKRAQEFVAFTNRIMQDDSTSGEEKLLQIDQLLADYG